MKRMLMQVIMTLLFVCAALITPIYGRSPDLLMLNDSALTFQKPDSLLHTAPTRDRKTRIHFTAGYEFWPANKFESIKLSDSPSLLGDLGGTNLPSLESARYFEVAFTFPKMNLGGYPITLGGGIENLHYQYGGFLDVDQITSGWLSETYYGEYLVHTIDVRSYSLMGSLNLKPFKPRHTFGYSARVFGSLRYFDVVETERLTMQGDYHVNGSTGQMEYQTETFQRAISADKVAVEAGGRLELHATRFISLILPQVLLRGTIYRNTLPAIKYTSGIDGDKIELSERKSNFHGIFLMIGIQLHL